VNSEINIFKEQQLKLNKLGFNIINKDENRPWGGFFVIDESQAEAFAKHFFSELNFEDIKKGLSLSPKILVVKSNQRLSWQYHHRRSELWKVIEGVAGIVRSNDDVEGVLETLNTGKQIILKQGERHRLVGLEDYAVIAEIWQHIDANNPSDENDIVRVQDDYGR
jgi:mannose-6-phosphate isomerase-like protein (cupin superfamily)